MPPYRFLFEKRKRGSRPSLDALNLSGLSPRFGAGDTRTNWTSPDALKGEALVAPAAEEIVPTDEARALVAYLLSLRSDVPLFERPLSAATAKPAAPATNAPANAVSPPAR
jgi:hypothetical protein